MRLIFSRRDRAGAGAAGRREMGVGATERTLQFTRECRPQLWRPAVHRLSKACCTAGCRPGAEGNYPVESGLTPRTVTSTPSGVSRISFTCSKPHATHNGTLMLNISAGIAWNNGSSRDRGVRGADRTWNPKGAVASGSVRKAGALALPPFFGIQR